VHRVAHYDAHHAEAAAEPREGAQIISRNGASAAAPLERQHGLRRQAQLVRHSYADAAAADIETEESG
jgi:hypothetical protein